MFATVQWARTIAAGDWLSLDPPHHFASWMQAIAPLEEWKRWWGHAHTLTRAPLYETLVGLSFRVFGETPWPILALQLVVGAVQVLALYYVAATFIGTGWALAVAAMGAVYGPYVYQQGTLVRDALSGSVHTILFAGFLAAQRRNTGWRWGACGAGSGVATLLRESSVGFFLLQLVMLACGNRARPGRLLGFALVSVAAYLAVLSPLVYRNVRLGLPPFHMTDYLPVNVVVAWAPDAQPIGLRIPPSLGPTLREADGQLGRVVEIVARSYRGRGDRFLELLRLKVQGFFDAFEVPNNDNYYYARDQSWLLRACLGYRAIWPLAMVGLGAMLLHIRRAWPLALYLALTMVGILNVTVIGRYRLDSVAPLLVLAGWGLRVAVPRGSRPNRTWLPLAAVVGLWLVHPLLAPIDAAARDRLRARSVEYRLAELIYAAQGRPEASADELRRWRAIQATLAARTEDPHVLAEQELSHRVAAIERRLAAGEPAGSERDWERVEEAANACAPTSRCHEVAGQLCLRAGRRAQARRHFAAALAGAPEGPGTDRLRKWLDDLSSVPP